VDALDLTLARRSIRPFTTQDISLEDEQKLIDAAFAGATENILLEATALGLGSVWCGMREDATEVVGCERACSEVLGIPVGKWRVLALVGIGHSGEKKQPPTQRQVSKVSYERFGKRSR
jgi:nitroreductase